MSPLNGLPHPKNCHREESLWFDDGTIVFQAGATLFRIYSGLLEARSSVFRDMFSFPQPMKDRDVYNGVPLIHLPDEARSVKYFLLAIFDSTSFRDDLPISHPNCPTYPQISAIVRLSNKYDCPDLHQKALRRLSSYVPITFREFIESTSLRTPLDLDYIDLASLAIEVDALWLLPFAFYSLATAGIDMDDVWTVLQPQPQLFLQYIKGYQRQILWGSSLLRSFAYQYPNARICVPCGTQRLALIDGIGHLQQRPEAAASLTYISPTIASSVLCSDCIPLVQAKLSEKKTKCWNALPEIYQLPSFDKLVQMRQDELDDY